MPLSEFENSEKLKNRHFEVPQPWQGALGAQVTALEVKKKRRWQIP
jgi:hypothetical protein